MICSICSSNKTQIKFKDFHINEEFETIDKYQLYCFDCNKFTGEEFVDISATGPDVKHIFKAKQTVKSLNMLKDKYVK